MYFDLDRDAVARANVDGFLDSLGMSFDQLSQEIPSEPDDLVLVTGSVAEGLGTPVSDIDLLVVGVQRRAGALHLPQDGNQEIVYRLSNGIELNIAYLETAGVRALEATLRTVAENIASPAAQAVAPLDGSALLMAHRLRTGAPLRGDVAQLREQLRLEVLPDYMLIRSRFEHFVYREDALGQLQVGHPDSARYMMSFAFHHVASVALGGLGETNPDPKWRLRLLQRNRDRLGGLLSDQLCDYLLGYTPLSIEGDFERAFEICDQVIHDAVRRRSHLADLIVQLDEGMKFVVYKATEAPTTPTAALPR